MRHSTATGKPELKLNATLITPEPDYYQHPRTSSIVSVFFTLLT